MILVRKNGLVLVRAGSTHSIYRLLLKPGRAQFPPGCFDSNFLEALLFAEEGFQVGIHFGFGLVK